MAGGILQELNIHSWQYPLIDKKEKAQGMVMGCELSFRWQEGQLVPQ